MYAHSVIRYSTSLINNHARRGPIAELRIHLDATTEYAYIDGLRTRELSGRLSLGHVGQLNDERPASWRRDAKILYGQPLNSTHSGGVSSMTRRTGTPTSSSALGGPTPGGPTTTVGGVTTVDGARGGAEPHHIPM